MRAPADKENGQCNLAASRIQPKNTERQLFRLAMRCYTTDLIRNKQSNKRKHFLFDNADVQPCTFAFMANLSLVCKVVYTYSTACL